MCVSVNLEEIPSWIPDESPNLYALSGGNTYGNIQTPASGWGSRRMTKQAKMENLDVQRSLKAEIKAKMELQVGNPESRFCLCQSSFCGNLAVSSEIITMFQE